MGNKRIIKPSNWPYFDYRDLPYSLAVEKGGLLFLSGQTAEREDPSTSKIECAGTAEEQMSVVMEKQRNLIEAAGASPEDLTNLNLFQSSAGGKPILDQAWKNPGPPKQTPPWEQVFGRNYAPGTGIFVQGNLNLRAIINSDLTLDMRPGEKRYINPGFPPEPGKAAQFYEWGTNRPGVYKNGILWSAGQAPWYLDQDWQVHSHETLMEQTRFLYEKFERILGDAGLTYEDVIMTRDYIIPAARPFYRATADVRREFFGDEFPASTGVVIVALFAPDWLIEINMVAVKEGKREIVLGDRALAQGLTYMPGVKKGNLFFASGSTGHDSSTGKLAEGGIAAQARQTYKNIAEVLEAGGASFGDVVKVTDYIDEAGLPGYTEAAEVRREFFGDSLPAVTTTVCNRIFNPNSLIEIEATAVLN